MAGIADPRLIAFCGSETRVSTLGVLANSSEPLTGYRVSKLAGVQPIKVYRELDRAVAAGIVRKGARGYVLSDPDLRALLQKRVRVSWSESWYASEGERGKRASRVGALSAKWVDSSRYEANPAVAARYATEFERPPEKADFAAREGVVISRKRR